MLKNKLLRYLIVGGSAYVMEMLIILGLHNGLGLSPISSVAISFWFGLVIAFVLQKFITFENHEKRIHMLGLQLTLYACLVAANYLITLLAVRHFSPRNSVFEIRTAVIILSTIWNYVVYDKLLFRHKPLKLSEVHAQKDPK